VLREVAPRKYKIKFEMITKLDRAGISEKAQSLAIKGLLDKAVSEWQKLLDGSANDGNICNTIGDLHLKAGHSHEAVSAYLKAAEAFKKAGFDLKSAAIYKKIIQVDPSLMDVHEKMADLHALRGLAGKAIPDYLKIAKCQEKQGNMGAALLIYQKISPLAPHDGEIHVKIAEIHEQLGSKEHALHAYEAAYALYEQQKQKTQIRILYDRIHQLRSELQTSKQEDSAPQETRVEHSEPEISLPSLRESLETALAREDRAKAQSIIESLNHRPRDQFLMISKWVEYALQREAHTEAFVMLERAVGLAYELSDFSNEVYALLNRYRLAHPEQTELYPILTTHLEKMGKGTEAVSVYSDTLSKMQSEGHISVARQIYAQFKDRFPESPDTRRWQDIFGSSGGSDLSDTTSAFSIRSHSAENVSSRLSEDPMVPTESSHGEPFASVQNASIPHPFSEVAYRNYLTEADVYIKYKLYAKATEHLQMVVRLVPERSEPHMRLADLFVKQGQIEQAMTEYRVLAQMHDHTGMLTQKAEVLARIEEIDPADLCHKKADDMPWPLWVDAQISDPDHALPPEEQEPEHMQEAETSEHGETAPRAFFDRDEGDREPPTEVSEIPIIEEALTETPEDDPLASSIPPLQTRYQLGTAYLEMGLREEAIKEFDALMHMGFCVGETSRMIARCHQEDGRVDMAIEALRAGLNHPQCAPEDRASLDTELARLCIPGSIRDSGMLEVGSLASQPGKGAQDGVGIANTLETHSIEKDISQTITGRKRRRIAYV